MIWWCAEHIASYQLEAEPGPPRWGCRATDDVPELAEDCRMVEALLIVQEPHMSDAVWQSLVGYAEHLASAGGDSQ